jgi:hypothetical protein
MADTPISSYTPQHARNGLLLACPSAVVTNTTDTTIFEDADGDDIRFQITAGWQQVGSSYEFVFVPFVQADNAADTFTFRVLATDGTTTTALYTTGAINAAAAENALIKVTLEWVTIGSAGTARVYREGAHNLLAASSVFGIVPPALQAGTISLITTANTFVYCDVDMSAANAGNIARLDMAYARKLAR